MIIPFNSMNVKVLGNCQFLPNLRKTSIVSLLNLFRLSLKLY